MIDLLHHERSHTHGFLVRASMLAFVLGFNPVLSDATPLGHHLRRDNGADNVKAKIWVSIRNLDTLDGFRVLSQAIVRFQF